MLKVACIILLCICLSVAVLFIALMFIYPNMGDCTPSKTTASGAAATHYICSGSLIFQENFEHLDKGKWVPEVTFYGGGNGEFQWYVADDENSYIKDGRLHIKPTLTESKIGADQLEHGHVNLTDCTDKNSENCERQAGGNVIINPIRSARLTTAKSFSFKYGRVEVIAKMPTGDWLWPAVWLLPSQWMYGDWPRSGEIDLFECRGNVNYSNTDGRQIGAQQIASTLHFGPSPSQDAYKTSTFSKNDQNGFNDDFHRYEFIWDENGFKFLIDSAEIGNIPVNGGFWKRGGFEGDNIWQSGTEMAPFDQEFHFIINLAVGGTNGYFPDSPNGAGEKPWDDAAISAMKDFWENRSQWLPTWHMDNDDTCLIIDSIRVWAI